jgi:hypothetical protein
MPEQLQFVKAQYEGAIEEIKEAQDVISTLEEQRECAVEEARREREKVRILEEDIKLKEAREVGYEEGRRLGMEEGVKRGAAEGKRYGVKDGREAERERQKKSMPERVEDDEVGEPRERHRESSEPHEMHGRVGDEAPGLSRSRSLNLNPTIAPVVTVDPQTHTFNVIGLPLLRTVDPTVATYPPAVPASFFRDLSVPLGNREQPNRGNGPPSNSVFSPRNTPTINILAGFQDEPVRVMGMNAPELSMEASLGKRDHRTSVPSRISTSGIDRDRDQPNSAQQRSWSSGVIVNGQGYRTPIRQRSGSGGTNGTSGTGINGVPRTTGRTSVTPPSTPLDHYGTLGDGVSYGGGLIRHVAEMSPIMEGGSEPGPTPTDAHIQGASTGVRPQQVEIDHREKELQEKEQSDGEERTRYEKERTMRYSVRDQDPPMTTRSRAQSMSGMPDRTDSQSLPIYASAGAVPKARLPPPKSARMMPGGLPQNQSGKYILGVESRSGSETSGGPMPSPSRSQSSSQIRKNMEEDADTPMIPYDEEDTGRDRNGFLAIDIFDEKAERWEPKSGTFRERELPRGHNQDDVEIVPVRLHPFTSFWSS